MPDTETKTVTAECPKCGNAAEVNSKKETGAPGEYPVVCDGDYAVEDGAVVDYKERAKKLHEEVVLGYNVPEGSK